MLFCEMQYPKGRYCLQENVLPWSKVCLDLSDSYIVAYLDLEANKKIIKKNSKFKLSLISLKQSSRQ